MATRMAGDMVGWCTLFFAPCDMMNKPVKSVKSEPVQSWNVVFLDRDTIAPQTTLRNPSFPHTLTVHARTAPDQVAERIRDAHIVITNKAPVHAHALRGAGRLKCIAVAATGTDCIDLHAAAAQGVTVSNIRGYAVNTVPEHTFALIFALRRSLLAYRDSVRQGRWQQAAQFCYFDHPIRDLAGSTLGIIGGGVLGQAVANIGRSLGMHVLFAARKAGAASNEGASNEGASTSGKPLVCLTAFDDVLARSDVITLHCPLRPNTRNLIDAPEFAAMRRKPLLINTARGGLVNEQALALALRSGQILGAGFDVATTEPPASDHVFTALLDLPNFILTPHVAWASDQAMQTLADQLIDNIEAFVAGSPRNVVAPA